MFVLFGTGLTRVLTCVVSHVSVGRTCVCKQGPERQCAVCHSDTSWQQGLLQWAHWSLANNLLSPLVSAPFSALSCHSPPSCGFSHQQFLFFLLPLPLLTSPLVLKVFYWGCKESVNTGERRALCCSLCHSVGTSKATFPSKAAATKQLELTRESALETAKWQMNYSQSNCQQLYI